jgi:hypothetical protein
MQASIDTLLCLYNFDGTECTHNRGRRIQFVFPHWLGNSLTPAATIKPVGRGCRCRVSHSHSEASPTLSELKAIPVNICPSVFRRRGEEEAVRIAKIIGLVSTVALTLTALVGVGSASAAETALCKSSTSVPYCNSGDLYPGNTALNATSTEVTIPTNLVNVKCKSSNLEGETKAQTGDPLAISVASWSLASCTTYGGSKCSATAQGGPYDGSLAWTSGDDGDLTVRGAGLGDQMRRRW